MKTNCNITPVISTFLLLFLYSTPTINAEEVVNDEAEFEYDDKGTKGPRHWGELKKEWGACKGGYGDQMQSPIDICNQSVEVVPNSGELIRNYEPSDAALKNRGHDISLRWLGDAGSIQINGTDYFLKQCHWHSPSEHSINGLRYDLELHMVHASRDDQNAKNNLAVVAMLYKIGDPDAFISKLSTTIMSLADTHDEKKVGRIDPKEVGMKGSNYYRYMGSLTVPPCTEGVIWTINEELATISKEQVKLLRDAVHDFAEENARPVQPLNGRKLQLYRPAGGCTGGTQASYGSARLIQHYFHTCSN